MAPVSSPLRRWTLCAWTRSEDKPTDPAKSLFFCLGFAGFKAFLAVLKKIFCHFLSHSLEWLNPYDFGVLLAGGSKPLSTTGTFASFQAGMTGMAIGPRIVGLGSCLGSLGYVPEFWPTAIYCCVFFCLLKMGWFVQNRVEANPIPNFSVFFSPSGSIRGDGNANLFLGGLFRWGGGGFLCCICFEVIDGQSLQNSSQSETLHLSVQYP